MVNDFLQLLQNPFVSIGILALVIYLLIHDLINRKKNNHISEKIDQLNLRLTNDLKNEIDNFWEEFRKFKKIVTEKIDNLEIKIKKLEFYFKKGRFKKFFH